MPHRVGILFHVRGNGLFAHSFPVVAIEVVSLHGDQVDAPFKRFAGTNWDLHHDGIGRKLLADHFGHAVCVCTGSVLLLMKAKRGTP